MKMMQIDGAKERGFCLCMCFGSEKMKGGHEWRVREGVL